MDEERAIINGRVKRGNWWGKPIMLRDENGVYYHSTSHDEFSVASEKRSYFKNECGEWDWKEFNPMNVVA